MKAGWKTVKLGDILKVQNGYAFDSKFFGTGGMPLIRIRDIKHGTTTETSYSGDYDEAYVVHSGDYLIGMDGEFRCYMWRGPAALLNQRVCRLTNFSPNALPAFICYGINKYLKEIEDVTGYSTVKHLSSKSILSIQFPLPPLAEQKRIVALLDEAFAGIDEAKAKAESNWRDANTLFASRLEEIFAQAGLGWTQMRMEEVVAPDCSLSYGIVQPGDDFSEGMPVVRPTDLTSNVIYLSGLKRIDPKLAEGYARTTLQGGELLLCVRGSTGAVSIASEELAGANVTRGIVPIRFNKAMVLPDFGFYLISGGPVQAQIQEKTYGTALMQINIRDLRLISVSIPPLSEQNEIAQKMTDFHAKVQALTDLYERKASSFASLRNSLLTQAFAGELTA